VANSLKRRLETFRFDPKFRPNFNELERATESTAARLGGGEVEVVPEDADTLLRKFRSEWVEHRDLKQLSRRVRRLFPHLLFYPLKAPDQWLANDEALKLAVRDYVEDPRNTRALISLCYAFLRAFPMNSPVFDAYAGFCEASLEQNTRIRSLAMREASERFRLFSSDGPAEVAKFWLASSVDIDSPKDVPELSVMSPAADSRFAHHLARALLKSVPDYLEQGGAETPTDLERKLHLVPGLDTVGSRVDPDLRKSLAEALLEPFQQNSPPEVYKSWARPFVLRHLGHPRIQLVVWSEVNESARSVMLRWMVEDTLDQFFHVLDKTAVDRQWRARKDFWTGYLNKGVIQQAWVVLGTDAARVAKRTLDDESAFGRLRGARQRDQSVLLMEFLPSLVVAEWSHNGACQFWDREEKKAPEFFEHTYDADDLRDGSMPKVNHQPAKYPERWQVKIAERIYQQTRISDPVGSRARRAADRPSMGRKLWEGVKDWRDSKDVAPRCPQCQATMRIKLARKGRHRGKEFWGCSRYPACKGIVNR